MAPVGRLLVLRSSPKSELMNATATITRPALLAPVIGPVLGAGITETFGWQWNFFVNLPLGVACILSFVVFVRNDAPAAPRPFDGPGFALCDAALLVFLGGLELFVNGRPPAPALPLAASGTAFGFFAMRYLNR